jgi:serine/threonine-protein kinase
MTERRLVDHRYLLGDRLGQGAFGTVHRAEHMVLGIPLREVAVKLFAVERLRLPPKQLLGDALNLIGVVEACSDPAIRDLFVACLDAGLDEDGNYQPFVVMELVPGSLHHRIGGQPLPVETALRYARQLARGVAFLHAAGYVHRDLKPDNVLLTADDRIKLADFGLAMATAQLLRGQPPAGALAYQPPEALLLHRSREGADVYALGLICYEMLTGDLPFPRRLAVPERRDELIKAKLQDPEPPSRAANLELRDHPELERVLMTALAGPGERYQDGPELLAALESVGPDGRRAPAADPSSPPPSAVAVATAGPSDLLRRATAAVDGGDPDGAVRLIDQALEQHRAVAADQRQAEMYLGAVSVLVRANRYPEARAVAQEGVDWRHCRATWEAMAAAYNGNQQLADRYRARARAAPPC